MNVEDLQYIFVITQHLKGRIIHLKLCRNVNARSETVTSNLNHCLNKLVSDWAVIADHMSVESEGRFQDTLLYVTTCLHASLFPENC